MSASPARAFFPAGGVDRAELLSLVSSLGFPPRAAVHEMARFALDYRQCRKIHFAKCVSFSASLLSPCPELGRTARVGFYSDETEHVECARFRALLGDGASCVC